MVRTNVNVLLNWEKSSVIIKVIVYTPVSAGFVVTIFNCGIPEGYGTKVTKLGVVGSRVYENYLSAFAGVT